MIKKTNYFFVDESGNLFDDSPIFIHGLIKAENPSELKEELERLKTNILQDLYIQESSYLEDFIKHEFHATKNHPDIRAKYYTELPFMNFRVHLNIFNKKSQSFSDLQKEYSDIEIFEMSLKKLIKNMLLQHKNDKNIFYFETIDLPRFKLKTLLEKIFSEFPHFDHKFYVRTKKDIVLSMVDYLNYIFFILSSKNDQKGFERNFKIVLPRIGSIWFQNENVYLSRKSKEKLELTTVLKYLQQ